MGLSFFGCCCFVMMSFQKWQLTFFITRVKEYWSVPDGIKSTHQKGDAQQSGSENNIATNIF